MLPRIVEVPIDEAKIARLTGIFQTAYKNIVDEIKSATDFGVANRKAILSQINIILTDLGVDVDTFIRKELPEYYKSGATDAIEQLQDMGADIATDIGFNRVHKEAIEALIDETAKAFGESMSGVNRSAQLLLGKMSREMLTQKIAEGVIGGKAMREVKQSISGYLEQQGLDALVDKAGHSWSLDRYAEMLFRTKVVEARNRGLVNRMAENGYDLVQVSYHIGSCPICAPWQGRILSIRGETPGYPTVALAEAGGLFHPNCRHAINTVIPELASATKAYNSQTKSYGQSTQEIAAPYIVNAQKYQSIFEGKVQSIAKSTGLSYQVGPVKSVSRASEKIFTDYNNIATELKDYNRTVLFIDKKEDIATVKIQIEKQFGNVAREKKVFTTGEYQRVLININTPYGGQAEIQLTTKEMWKAKKELGGDELYHTVRVKKSGWQEAEKKMIALYTEAIEQHPL